MTDHDGWQSKTKKRCGGGSTECVLSRADSSPILLRVAHFGKKKFHCKANDLHIINARCYLYVISLYALIVLPSEILTLILLKGFSFSRMTFFTFHDITLVATLSGLDIIKGWRQKMKTTTTMGTKQPHETTISIRKSTTHQLQQPSAKHTNNTKPRTIHRASSPTRISFVSFYMR